MMTTIDSIRLVEDLAYVERIIAGSVVLQACKHHVYIHGQQVSVEVEGAHWEARAWRAAFAGKIFPSHYDSHHVRHQLVLAEHVEIEIVLHPSHGDEGKVMTGLMLIVACVGLFLWGWSHSSSSPNGAWIAAVAFVGAVVLLAATGLLRWRRRDRADAERTQRVVRRLEQDESGEHYWDGA